jgi:hypothetical protein
MRMSGRPRSRVAPRACCPFVPAVGHPTVPAEHRPGSPGEPGHPGRSGDQGREHLAERVRDAYREEVDHTHQSLFNAAVAFTLTFAGLRGLTYALRYDLLPWGDIVTGGVHLHHYVWGVGLLLVVGMVSLIVDSPRYNPLLGVLYGVATALVVDEFALLLNLRDVYWTKEGRVSVDIALCTIAVAAVYFTAKAFWRRLGHELVRWIRGVRPRNGP